MCVFAPRNPAEFERVLRPGGTLVVAQPLPGHLAGLRERYGLLGVGEDKSERLAAALPGWDVTSRERLTDRVEIPAAVVADLIAMGPNAFHGLPDHVEDAFLDVDVEVIALVSPTAA